jgi:hypothetical protein
MTGEMSMCIDVDLYQKDDRSRWERFISTAENGTIFHRQRFLAYHPPDRFRSHHLIFRKKNRMLAVLPAVIREQNGRRMLISHAGASYGGFVIQPRLGIRECHLLVEAFVNYLKDHGFDQTVLTPPPIIYQSSLSNAIDFALLKNGFRYLRRELTSVVPLPKNEEEIFASFKSEARTAARKAMKMEVKIRESEDFAGFYGILRKNLRMRHGVAPTHTLDELLRLKSAFPDEIRLFCAYRQKQQLAGVVLFVCNPQVILAFYISHRDEFQKYRPVNLLFYHIMDWGRRREFRYLDFGTFTLNMEPNWGLGKFKETFGARGLFRDTFVLDLSVP